MTTLFLVALLAAAPSAPPAPDVVVVCPAVFLPELEPWLAHRRAEGHVVGVLPADRSPEDIKAALHEAYKQQPQLSVVLVGDAEPGADRDPALRARCVPAKFYHARVNVIFGSEPEIATDNWYVDFDDDGVPEASIGRLPVDTPAELSRLVERILTYERSADFGVWRRRINLVAGLGGFGAVADTALENAAKTLLTRHVPAGFDTTMTYAGKTSPYYPGAAMFGGCAVNRFCEGGLMWVYLGHGSRHEVDRIVTPQGAYPILRAQDLPLLKAGRGTPLACFLSCYSGAFDGPQDCLAEEMLRVDGGPVGVMCGSRVTLPYAMSVLGQELMSAMFQNRATTIGRVLLDAKRASVFKSRDDAESKQFDALATMLMPMAPDLDAQRRENVALFNLLGDPLLKVRHPQAVEVATAPEVTAGERLAIRGTTQLAGKARIELVVRRDRLAFAPPERNADETSLAGREERYATYERALDTRLNAAAAVFPAGPFELHLDVPATAKGDCHVRVYVEGDKACALGSADVRVRAAKRTE